MLDFANYAFNKSHAAAYAVVTFQTAWLKYYHPVSFMASLMTSVIGDAGKISEYVIGCKQMGIELLPPDINRSEGGFIVEDGKIRYALAAVRGVGLPVMDAITAEREERGPFKNLRDFCERLSGKEVNKRTLENFIKAGAFDSFGGNRRQFMQVYSLVLDRVNQEKKSNLSGQMNLFDLMGEEERSSYDVSLPPVEEFEKGQLLAFEKEVTGIYISGHPMEEYREVWQAQVSAVSTDFQPNEDTGLPSVNDQSRETIGGMITEKQIKYTKTNQTMAILTVEDLYGSIEVLAFPKVYAQYADLLQEDEKVILQGRVSVEEERPSKLLLDRASLLGDMPKELWLQCADRADYDAKADATMGLLTRHPGRDAVIIYLKAERQMKRIGSVDLASLPAWEGELAALFQEEDRKITAKKNIEKKR